MGILKLKLISSALKHYTSKLSSFDDLARLKTFGFRGEAISSLCALSDFRIVTAQANQAPKANRLEFDVSGRLKKTQIVAGQKGTTASVEGLFKTLPVRRRELEKNIKREYGKVLNLLHAYACVSTGVRFSVRNTVGKTKNVAVFTTNGNQTTKENIANVYGAKTLSALIALELALEFEPSMVARRRGVGGDQADLNKILVKGHISRPVFGEGRQTPDRQMFFVNSRPCGLPQIAKAFNEVYKSFNVSQSPFIFADFHMDTDAYDVNVSPDKRTILLHDAGALIESLKSSLTELFESSDQTVPQSQVLGSKSSSVKQYSQPSLLDTLTPTKSSSLPERDAEDDSKRRGVEEAESSQPSSQTKLKDLLSGLDHRAGTASPARSSITDSRESQAPPVTPRTGRESEVAEAAVYVNGSEHEASHGESAGLEEVPAQQDNEEEARLSVEDDAPQSSAISNEQLTPTRLPDSQVETPNTVQNAFDRMRPRRFTPEVATITIGNKTVTSMVGSGTPKKRGFDSASSGSGPSERKRRIHTPSRPNIFGKYMKGFAAPGSQLEEGTGSEDDEDAEEEVGDLEDDHSDEGSPSRSPSSDGSNISQHDTEDRGLSGANVDDGTEVHDAQPSAGPDENYIDEDAKRAKEEAEVQRLIQEAEERAVLPQENNIHRANKLNKGAAHRDSTVNLIGTLNGSLSRIQFQAEKLQDSIQSRAMEVSKARDEADAGMPQETAEERLSLRVTKDDFAKMRIIGQFNLGFIIARRSSQNHSDGLPSKDELFIIDQHASDEKFNFERLQSETVVQNQRLVQPKTLDLTAVEEEVVLEHQATLEKNGFIVEIDDSGNEPIGRRCKLVSLPLSKEVVFGARDLEELIALLSESPTLGSSASDSYIPRPGKVRKMFAMRACRSSIMIGKTLTQKQMQRVVRNLGTIDKPWNCPHGRPTMRHLMGLGQWDEWDEFSGAEGEDRLDAWRAYAREMTEDSDEEEDEE